MRVLISGGGTGGHIYPALAIARRIKDLDDSAEILYVGTTRGLEAEIVPKTGIPFKTITVEGLPRKLGLRLFVSLFKVGKGLKEAMKIVNDFKPSVVVGTGGYVCGPIVLAAFLKGIPTLVHEQNAFPGITNKLLSRVVNKVAATFPESVKYFKKPEKVIVTGLPIRSEILKALPEEAKELGLSPDKFNILVVGGSRGARTINLSMVDFIEHFDMGQDIQILHVSGEVGFEELTKSFQERGIDLSRHKNIKVMPYLHQMPVALAVADLIICRAGATTLAEITAKGIPSILIPYPYASENHQEYNAKALVDKGAAIMIRDSDLTGTELKDIVGELLANPNRLKEMSENAKKLGRPDALDNLVNLVRNLAE